jgi:hypothetical protein
MLLGMILLPWFVTVLLVAALCRAAQEADADRRDGAFPGDETSSEGRRPYSSSATAGSTPVAR